MKVVSVNVSLPRAVPHGDRTVVTGIFKTAVSHRVKVGTLGLAGDGQADLENHGGLHKAVYAYPVEHYSFWSRELGRNDFVHGQFGENLTVEGLAENEVFIGNIYRIGGVLVEVTQPRVPCYKLALRMNLPDFPKRFAASGRTGFYLRVLEEGELGAGDAIESVKTDPRALSVHALMRLMYFERDNFELAEKALGIPALTPSWRDELKERLLAKSDVGAKGQ
ncbi:MAG TPA: MOSC domain-containing protein [Verrucomicrobiae bacterium]|nr:MOSC domain-containing protein [Verrucomicrobiae bacterium]